MKLRNIFQTRPKISDLRLESYTTILKQLSTSTENGLRKKFFECDLFYMKVFLWFWVVFSNYCQNVLRAVVKTALYVSRGIIWLACLQNFRLFFRFWTKIYRSFDHEVSPLFSKKHSTCSEEQLEKMFFSSFCNFFPIWVIFLRNSADLRTQHCQNRSLSFREKPWKHFSLKNL